MYNSYNVLVTDLIRIKWKAELQNKSVITTVLIVIVMQG